jgi:hypothetical protein
MQATPLKSVNDGIDLTDEEEEQAQKSGCGPLAACCDYSSQNKARYPFWDNYQGFTQFLIIFFMHIGTTWATGAGVPQLMDSAVGKLFLGFGAFTFPVCMPSYCFITGLFSTANMNRKQRINIVRFMVVWLIQHAICCFFGGIAESHEAAVQSWEGEHLDLNATNAALQAQGRTFSPTQCHGIGLRMDRCDVWRGQGGPLKRDSERDNRICKRW